MLKRLNAYLNVVMLVLILASLVGLFLYFTGLVGLWLSLGTALAAGVFLIARMIARC